VSSIVRILEFLGSAVRLDEASAHDLGQLKASMRRLASQLSAMHRPTTSIETLEAAGKWAEMEEVRTWRVILALANQCARVDPVTGAAPRSWQPLQFEEVLPYLPGGAR
jgi:hypothetical protein